MTDTIALALVALEIDEPPDALAARLGLEVMLGVAGIRHVDVGLAERLITAHRARQAQARHRADERRERFRARDEKSGAAALRRRHQARAERDRALLEVDPNMPALAAMLASDPDNRLNRTGRVLDEMLHQPGQFTYHPGRPR